MPAAADNFPSSTGLSSPITHSVAATPDNANDVPFVTRSILVGVSGDVQVTMAAGNIVILPALAAGIAHPFRVSRIWAANTTASRIVISE